MCSRKLAALASVTLALVLFAPQALLAQYAISTVAGGGPNNLAAHSASIGYPGSIAFDAAGNTYIADSYSSRIFKVDMSGTLTVVAGNGTHGYSGDGGLATSAALGIFGPEGIAVDGSGNIFIADTDNSVIREVSASTGNITTVVTGLNDPVGIFVDASGDIFIADTDNAVIREVVAGTIQTVAGTLGTICPDSTTPCGDGGPATSAQLDLPEGVFVDGSGNIFIADTDDSRIRVVNTGTATITIAGVTIPPGYIQTVAGAYYDSQGATACQDTGDNGPALSAYLCAPTGVFVDASENIFIADTNNFAIREVAASTIDIITTVAGTLGMEGYSPNGTLATSAELNYPSNMVVDSSGDIFIADTDNFVIREVTVSNSDIATIIGNNTLAYSGDGGSPLDAELNYPSAVSANSAGDIFIADTDNSVIREVLASSGDIQTVAGNGTDCLDPTTACGDGGAATSAQLNTPFGTFLDASGNIFIADTEDNRIRVVNTGTQALTYWGISIPPGDITTVAGNGTFCPNPTTACGDNGPATSAELNAPYGVFVDSAENIFIADTQDYKIREVAASNGYITTVAGNGTQCTQPAMPCGDGAAATGAQLDFPSGVFVDLSENIYIADEFDNRIRAVNTSATQPVTIAGVVIQPSDIATLAGTGARGYAGDGAAATSALLNTPFGVFVDLSGDIFIADTGNTVIREVVAATGDIQTVAGNNTQGFSGDGSQATSAELYLPLGLFGDSVGDLFIADTSNSRIRELVPAIFVTVTPISVNVAVGTQLQFTATVTGTSNTSVTWQVNGVVNGNSTVGTISTAGLFQAPATIPTPATVTITAISQADNTTSGSVQATIVPVGDAVNVTVSTNPVVTEVYTTTTQSFIATVTGTSNTAVTWQVNGVTGGNATVGTIDNTGNYTAPTAVPTPNPSVVIEAISQALSSAIGAESVMIVTDPSAAEPTPQTATPGGSATYSLLLNENISWPGGPVTLSCLQSTLPPNANCVFAPTTITPGAQAVPFSLTITVPTGSASLEKPNGMRLQLFLALAFGPLAGILFAGAGRRNKKRNKRRYWLWLAGLCVFLVLMNACGGGSSTPPTNPELGTYNVKIQGTTSAQPNPVTITVAGLQVNSQ
jgi:sugar lactone lactonase YvrE